MVAKSLYWSFIDLVLQVDDGLAVGRPAGVAAGLGHAGAAAAVDVHHVDVAAFRLALALLELEGDLLAVGRDVGIVLVVAGLREDDRVRTVGIPHDQRPMAVAVAFVDDAVGVVLQLGEEFFLLGVRSSCDRRKGHHGRQNCTACQSYSLHDLAFLIGIYEPGR